MTHQFDLLAADGCIYPIHRDVATTHPLIVHETLGTTSERELQAALDGLNTADWFGADGQYLGRDHCGLGLAAQIIYDVRETASGHAVYDITVGRDRYAEFLDAAEAAEAAARLNSGDADESDYLWQDDRQ